MGENPKPSGRGRSPARSRTAREARVRRRFCLALLASAGAHAALFALPAIDIPLLSNAEAARRVITHETGLAASRPIELVRIVEIRPPGPASAAGGGSTPAAGATVAGPPGAGAAPTRTPPPRIRSALRLALSAVADTGPASPAIGPPKRGVYQRADGSSVAGSGRFGGAAAGSGPGLGSASGGVTVIGPGGDCITPGVVPRTGTVGLPGLSRPGGASRPGVGRSGRP